MAIDLVCGMIVDEKSAPARTSHGGGDYYFCAPHCKEAFEREPQRYIDGTKQWGDAVDPVCGMTVEIPPGSCHERVWGPVHLLLHRGL
jgi:YHS domain-containing protein